MQLNLAALTYDAFLPILILCKVNLLTPNTMLKKHLLVVLAIVAAIMTGCSGVTTPNETKATNIEIGAIAPLQGENATLGIPMQQAAELAVADVNESWKDSGMTFTINWENGSCNGQDGSSAAQKLVNIDQMEVILGLCSGEVLGAAPITEGADVVLFSPSASSSEVTTAGEYVYRSWPSDKIQGERLAELAYDLGYRSVAMLTEVTDYTEGVQRDFTTKFESLGGVVYSETYLPDATDFKTELTKLNNKNAEILFLNPQNTIKSDVILKQLQELGIKGPFLLNDVAGTQADLLSTYSDYLDGSYTATFAIDQDSKAVQEFTNRYVDMYGEEPQYLAYMAAYYDAVWILANALAEVGNNGDAVKNYLDNFPGYDGLTGHISFDENGDLNGGHAVFMIVGGELVMQ